MLLLCEADKAAMIEGPDKPSATSPTEGTPPYTRVRGDSIFPERTDIRAYLRSVGWKGSQNETVRETPTRVAGENEAAKDPVSKRDDSEKNFAVAFTAYGALFGTGLLQLAAHDWWSGGIFTAGGALGLMSVAPIVRSRFGVMRSGRSLWAAVAVTLLFLAANFGVAVYDHLGNRQSTQVSMPSTVQIPASEPGKRTIVNVTPEYLMSLYDNKLSDQGDRLFAPFIGKWIPISGQIMNIQTTQQSSTPPNMPIIANTTSAVTLTLTGPHQMKSISLLFDKKWAEKLSVLARDQNISALCQIQRADDSDLYLDHCELEDK